MAEWASAERRVKGSITGADAHLCRRMGQRARQAFDAEFDKSMAVARWESLLLEVADAGGGNRREAEMSAALVEIHLR